MSFSVISKSVSDTIAVGKALGQLLGVGDIICLYGDLGAGKTHFAQGIGLGMGVRENMSSPTFAFINEYEGIKPLMHADLYRIEAPHELEDIGIDEYLHGPWTSIIEWPERAAGILPPDRLDIRLLIESDGCTRRVEFLPSGSRARDICEVLAVALSGN